MQRLLDVVCYSLFVIFLTRSCIIHDLAMQWGHRMLDCVPTPLFSLATGSIQAFEIVRINTILDTICPFTSAFENPVFHLLTNNFHIRFIHSLVLSLDEKMFPRHWYQVPERGEQKQNCDDSP